MLSGHAQRLLQITQRDPSFEANGSEWDSEPRREGLGPTAKSKLPEVSSSSLAESDPELSRGSRLPSPDYQLCTARRRTGGTRSAAC